MPTIHHLSDKDPVARSATCSVCGPVRIGKAGRGWACSVKMKEHTRRWRAKNPNRDHGRGKNPHALESRDVPARRAVCAKCGPVEIEPWARGWICSNRARQLGRVVKQETVQQHCLDCKAADGVLVWLTDGACLRCAEVHLDAELAKLADDERLMADLLEWAEAGLHLVGPSDPYAMPEYESAVPGWKTLG